MPLTALLRLKKALEKFWHMSVMGGLQALGIFKAIANTLLHWANGLRQLTLLLVMLCFFFAMVVTNDVALITFVPFTIMNILFAIPLLVVAFFL